jgi:hypothetical protein
MLEQMRYRTILFVSLGCFLRASAFAYGPIGHQIVGAVADERLANTPAGEKVRALLDGLSLQKAAVIPDEIKGWDKNGADDPNIFHYSSRPGIDAQLRDFWRANPPTQDHASAIPSHHWFHYTDVSVLRPQRYGDGRAGRSEWDIVHAMRDCIAVLKGDAPEENERKVTKAIAVILLAHFVGDLHQPLHVGAEYFNDAGQAVDPESDKAALEDQGGNSIVLRHSPAQAAKIGAASSKLHSFWDTPAVNLNLPLLPKEMPKEERRARTDEARQALVTEFVRQEPAKWRLPDNVPVGDWPEAWANEILPIAKEAHARLRFSNVHAEQEENGDVIATGAAEEQPAPDHVPYEEWAAKVVRDELHKAGWRLADLLQKALQ